MGCTEVMLRTSITFVCKVDVAVLLGLSVYASTGIVVNRDNPVKLSLIHISWHHPVAYNECHFVFFEFI